MSFKDLTLTDSRSHLAILGVQPSSLCLSRTWGAKTVFWRWPVLACFSLNCLFITCSAGRMRFSRIISSSIGQDHIPTSEGRQPLLQPIFTPGIGSLRIHCGSVMVSKFTTLWRSGVPCLALSHYRLTIFPRVKTGWMLLPTIFMRYTWTNNISV